MQFLADIELVCEECRGRRFKSSVFEVRYKGKNIHEVLQMTVKEALAFFSGVPKVTGKIRVLDEVGLGYLRLGQSATTLSGGEAQRVRLAAHLAQPSGDGGEKTLFIFDEPTRGIDIGAKSEIYRLLNELAAQGKSIIMISSELPEVLRMSHRILVMCEGRITGELKAGEATQEAIMHYATQRVTQIQEAHAS